MNLQSIRLLEALALRFLSIGFGLLLTSSPVFAEFAEETVEAAKQSTVRIFAMTEEGLATGTGFVINRDGYVVTNYHVIEGADKVVVAYGRGGTITMKEASVVVSKPSKDLAILRCGSLPGIRPTTLVDRSAMSGQAVMAIGFPGILDDMSTADGSSLKKTGKPDEYHANPEDAAGFVPVTFPGNVGKEMPLDSGFGGSFRAIAHNAKISEGNSGGPLIDRSGRVAGVNVQLAGTKSGADYGFAIHSSELVTLARAHSISISVSSLKASSGGAGSGLQTLLLVAIAVFAAMMFLLVLREPRMVMVGAVSKLVGPPKSVVKSQPQRSRPAVTPPPISSSRAGGMRLRGRDLQGRSYDLPFSESDFKMGGGKLVVGRNQDISQLHLPHDSVSRQHTTLLFQEGVVHVEDRNSGNGTKVNGQHLTVGLPAIPLKPGDKLSLGEVDLIFETFK